jgi:hypothetical protein
MAINTRGSAGSGLRAVTPCRSCRMPKRMTRRRRRWAEVHVALSATERVTRVRIGRGRCGAVLFLMLRIRKNVNLIKHRYDKSQGRIRTYVSITDDLHSRKVVPSKIRSSRHGRGRFRGNVLWGGKQNSVAGKRWVGRLVLLHRRPIQVRINPQNGRLGGMEPIGRGQVDRSRHILLRTLRNSSEQGNRGRCVRIAVGAFAAINLGWRWCVL